MANHCVPETDHPVAAVIRILRLQTNLTPPPDLSLYISYTKSLLSLSNSPFILSATQDKIHVTLQSPPIWSIMSSVQDLLSKTVGSGYFWLPCWCPWPSHHMLVWINLGATWWASLACPTTPFSTVTLWQATEGLFESAYINYTL